MKRLAALSLVLSLSGCATLPGAGGQASSLETLKALGEHISSCDRRYQGGLGVGASFTFNIECKGQVPPSSPET